MSDATDDATEKPFTVEYPDYAGYPDGEGIVGNGPTTDAPPAGVADTVGDEPETDFEIETDDETVEVNDG